MQPLDTESVSHFGCLHPRTPETQGVNRGAAASTGTHVANTQSIHHYTPTLACWVTDFALCSPSPNHIRWRDCLFRANTFTHSCPPCATTSTNKAFFTRPCCQWKDCFTATTSPELRHKWRTPSTCGRLELDKWSSSMGAPLPCSN